MNTTNIPNIKEIRHWFAGYVVRLCLDYNFYTCNKGNDYNQMLDFVNTHEATKENLYIVARDILEHSDESINIRYIVTDIMALLEKHTVLLDYLED